MAGIGFELRKLLKRDSYSGLFQAYAYAGIIGSGPLVLSMVGILAVGMMSAAVVAPLELITKFQITVTWLIMISLVLTGPLQLAFTRWVADRLFEKKEDIIAPNAVGMLGLVVLVSGVLGLLMVVFLFPDVSNLYRATVSTTLVVLSCIWMATIFLSGMKQYKAIVGWFAVGYSCTVASSFGLRHFGMEGLLLGYLLGQFVLLAGMLVMIMRTLPAPRFMSFEFLKKNAMFPELLYVGFIYNLAVWGDKLVFWLAPNTGETVIGPFAASVIYDLPSFLAYLVVIPGMAVFLVRIETDFVEYYQDFYNAVREGGSLKQISHLRDGMVLTIRQGLAEIIRIQGITALLVFVAGPYLLDLAGISQLYRPLLNLQVVAASLQVVLLGVLNVFFYLDRRRVVLRLSILLLVLNFALSAISIQLSPAAYGYGFAIALGLTVIAALVALEVTLEKLAYQTFMIQ
jgi:polysaccharide biosynthesis protein PelG